MISGHIRNRRLAILRAFLADPPAVDDWNQPVYDADVAIATVDGSLQPLSLREVASLTDAGAQVGDYSALVETHYVKPDGTQGTTDLTTADRVRDDTTGSGSPIYQVKSVLASARGRHLDVLLRRVVN